MTDVLTQQQRRFNMSRIRGKNTRPEFTIRRGLHNLGFRYSLHRRDLPGRPDLVMPKYNVCIFVHGCFWHGHSCPMFKEPKTRPQFWRDKIGGNRKRDEKVIAALVAAGWRCLVVWECALRGPHKLDENAVLDQCTRFIRHIPGGTHSLVHEIRSEKASV